MFLTVAQFSSSQEQKCVCKDINLKKDLCLDPEVILFGLLNFLHSVDLPIHRTLTQETKLWVWS